ncbi:hypothetical protein Nepgr_024168 [Nepenthes gracilis]|uniref:Uncharacterized protein n=1 Tax=Nepenthes gracilis TaxID=150966 RepID=A0AAD3T2M6_NEPGR|nr:hypothetical protein Nepgr_024168 [Nepenthes gracilis]
MPGIPVGVMVYKLGLDSDRKPIRQKQRNHSIEKLIAIRKEVKKLLDVRFIKEVEYSNWLSNMVLIRKSTPCAPDEVESNQVCLQSILGKILRVTQRGIEANPEKIKSLTDMSLPQCVKDVQRLIRRLAMPSHFLAKLGDKPAIKGQTLVDFIIETMTPISDEHHAKDADHHPKELEWVFNMDGSSTSLGSGAGVVLQILDGFEVKYSLNSIF